MAGAENYFEAELLKHLHGAPEAGTILLEADSAGYSWRAFRSRLAGSASSTFTAGITL